MKKHKNDYTKKEVVAALQELIKKGLIKKTKEGYIDSEETKKLLKEGKTRKEIREIILRRSK